MSARPPGRRGRLPAPHGACCCPGFPASGAGSPVGPVGPATTRRRSLPRAVPVPVPATPIRGLRRPARGSSRGNSLILPGGAVVATGSRCRPPGGRRGPRLRPAGRDREHRHPRAPNAPLPPRPTRPGSVLAGHGRGPFRTRAGDPRTTGRAPGSLLRPATGADQPRSGPGPPGCGRGRCPPNLRYDPGQGSRSARHRSGRPRSVPSAPRRSRGRPKRCCRSSVPPRGGATRPGSSRPPPGSRCRPRSTGHPPRPGRRRHPPGTGG